MQITHKTTIITIVWGFWVAIAPTLLCGQSEVLDWSEFRQKLLTTHPVALQAEMARANAEAVLLSAKGGFDVKLYSDYDSKNFNEKTYYSILEAGAKWPSSYGLELKTGFNHIQGSYINPQNQLPSNGQALMGLEWSVGQGLMIDERRANLRIAEAGLRLGLAERQSIRNELVLDAAKIYWSWVVVDNQYVIFQNALKQAQIRHEGLKESFKQGEKPAIDTLESFIQLQNRAIDLSMAALDRENALLQLQNFNWNNQKVALPIENNIKGPDLANEMKAATMTLTDVQILLDSAQMAHPDLEYYRSKGTQLTIEKKWKKEQLKPVLNIQYNILGNGWSFFPAPAETGLGVLANDIKWGAQFSYPIPNRKAKGGLQLAQLKIDRNDLSLLQKQTEISTKIRQYHNAIETLKNQIRLFQQITADNQALFEGESEKFKLGESTVFLVNTREQRWLDAQVKYLKLLGEYKKAEAALIWASGQGL